MDFLNNLLRGILFIVLTLVGLGITFMLLVAGILTMGIMYIVNLFKGQKFSASQYWQESRAKAQQTQTKLKKRFAPPSYSRRTPQDISDAEIRK